MKGTVAVLVAGVVLVGAGVASAATDGGAIIRWRIVKSHSTSGQFAVTAISADVKRPKPRGIAVRYIGKVSNGSAVVSCSKNFDIASWSRSYSHAGTYVVPMITGADSCTVVASVGGSGRVTVQILRRL